MNSWKNLLVLIVSVTLILPLILLSGCQTPTTTPTPESSPELQRPPTSTPSPASSMHQLAFAGNRYGKYALFVTNIDGSGEKQVTNRPQYDYAQSSWSPNGTWIAAESLGEHSFFNERGFAIVSWGIVIIDLNDGTEKVLTKGPLANSPDFSPYGNLIISDGLGSLTTVNLGGVVGKISVSQPGKLSNPSVSPDASKIAFEANVAIPPTPTPTPAFTPTPPPTPTRALYGGGAGIISGNQLGGSGGPEAPPTYTRIFVVDFDGTNLKQLTTSKDNYAYSYPTWSPDGKRIAFMSNRTGKNEIYVMDADGTGQTQITSDAFNNHDPAWSPDGAYIAFVADHSGISELVIIRPDGTGRTRVNKVAELVKNPAWRPIPGKTLGGLEPPRPTPATTTPTVTTNPPVTTTSPQPPTPTTGGLFISISGTNSPYSIYVNGALVGKESASLTLAPGSYRVTINNRNGTKVYDQMSTVIAGKTSQVKLSGKG